MKYMLLKTGNGRKREKGRSESLRLSEHQAARLFGLSSMENSPRPTVTSTLTSKASANKMPSLDRNYKLVSHSG